MPQPMFRRTLRQFSLFISFVMFFNALSPAMLAGLVYAEELTDVPTTQESVTTPNSTKENQPETQEPEQPTSTITDTKSEEEKPTETPVEEEKPAESEPGQPEPAAEQPAPQWLISPDGKTAVSNQAVKLGVTYVAPQNPKVSVTFTKLPAEPGTITIAEKVLPTELKNKLGLAGNVGYEITSSMQNGTFTYNLTLPKPQSEEALELLYSEDWQNFTKIQGEQYTDTQVRVVGLDHFTVFVNAVIPDADTNVRFVNSPRYIRQGNFTTDIVAQIQIPNTATNVTFHITGVDNGVTQQTITDADTTNNATDNDIYTVAGAPAGYTWWRLQKNLVAGEYTLDVEFNNGGTWYNIATAGTTYVLDAPTASYVTPSAAGLFFRPSDNPLRINGEDQYDQFNRVVFEIYDATATTLLFTHTVNKAQCNDQGNYVLCDIEDSATWAALAEGEYTAFATTYTQANNRVDDLPSGNFFVDATAPAVNTFTITNPAAVYGNNIDVEANATDTAPGQVKHVEFYMRTPRLADGVCVDNDSAGTMIKLYNDVKNGDDTYTHSFDVSDLGGDYCLFAKAEDLASHHSTASSIKVTIDNDGPVLTEVTPVTTPATDTTPSYTFNTTEAGNITYGGSCTSATAAAVLGDNTITFNALVDGNYTDCTITVTDAFGNASNVLDVTDFTIDTTAPNVPTLLTPADGASVQPTGLILDWSDEADTHGPVTYIYQSALVGTTGAQNALTTPIYTSGALATSQIDASGSSDNTYFWQARACDALNNCSDWSMPFELTIDGTAPVVTVNSLVTNDATPSLTGTVNDNTATINVNVNGNNYAATNNANGTWTLANNTIAPALTTGIYEVVVTATDGVGNAGTDATNNELEIDLVDPVVAITFPTNGSYVNTNIIAIRGTVQDDNLFRYFYQVLSPSNTNIASQTVVTSTSFTDQVIYTLNATARPDGVYTVRLRARDISATGNDAEVVITFTLDRVSPVLAEVTTVTNPTNDATPAYTFSSTEAGAITYGGACSSATTTAVIGNNTIDFNALADGTYTDCTITVTDAAGNVSLVLDVSDFTVDTVNPTLTEVTPVTTPDNDATPDYTFNSTEAGNITFGGACSSATTTAVVGNNTITFNALADGTYTDCTITVTDAAGNASNVLDVSDFTIDTVAPTLAEVTSVTNPTNDTTPAYTFSSTEAGAITYAGACASATANAVVGNNTIDFNALAEGTYTDCTITVTDAAGNASTALPVSTFTIDTTAPVLAEVTPVTNPTNDTTPAYTFSSTEAGAITYAGACASATANAVVGNNTIDFNALADANYTDCTITVTDAAGNVSLVLNVSDFTIDTVAPVVTQVTPVPTPDNDSTPTYEFNTNEAGTINFGGACSSTTTAANGNTEITFNFLPDGTYTDCTITVTDAAGNVSNVLDVNDFTIDTVAPVLVLGNVTVNEIVGSVPGPIIIDQEAGLTINYSGVTVADLQLAPNQATKTVTRTASITDAAGNTTTTTYNITVNNVGLNIPVLFGNSPATNTGVINITEDTNFTVGTNVTGGNAPYTFTFGGVCAGTGNTSNTLNLNPGTYGCTVTATDADGDTRSGSVSIVVTATGTTPGPVGNEGEPTNPGQVAGETDGEEEEPTTGGVLGALTCDQRATVRGNVYIDANANKVKDTTESGVNNITVELYTTANEFILRTTTNSEGIYQTDICPGTYSVRVTSANMPANSTVDSTNKNVTVSLTSTNNGVDFIVTVTAPAATSDFPWWAVILAVIVLLLLIAGYLISRRRGEQEYQYRG